MDNLIVKDKKLRNNKKRYDTGSSIKPDLKQSQVKIGVAQWQLL